MDLNYYEVLGISQTATNAEVEQAYRKVSKIYHPDAHNGISNPALFAAATKARNTLTDTQTRSIYDALLSRPAAGPIQEDVSRPSEPRAYTGPTPPNWESKRGYVFSDPKPKRKKLKSPSLLLVALALVVTNAVESHAIGASAINAILELLIWIALIGAFTIPKRTTRRFYAKIRRIVSNGSSKHQSKLHASK
jgi:curved DNA-binding protein CbpA